MRLHRFETTHDAGPGMVRAGVAALEEEVMALSDDLARLSVRAKEIENRYAAAKQQERDQLEQDVEQARASAQATVDKLHAQSTQTAGEVQAWGEDMQRSWSDHVAGVRQRIAARKARHDAKATERNAEDAEDYAEFAIAVASSAIEEAEYAVLDAALARADANAAASV
jgi:hypothetical protein